LVTGSQSGEAPPEPRRARRAIPTAVSVSIIGSFIILLVGALYYARAFFLPLVLALLVTITFAPLVRSLSRYNIPAGVSAVGLVILLGALGTLAATFLSGPVAAMAADAPEIFESIRTRFAFLREPFALLNDAIRQLETMGSDTGTGPEPERVVLNQSGILPWIAGALADIGTTLGATLILSLFLLSSSNILRHKLVHVLPALSEKKKSLRVLRDIENEVSRYLLTITAINTGFGVCVGAAVGLLGLPNPVLWGVAAGVLNFVPYIGGLVGTLSMIAISIVTFPTLTQAALPPLAYLAIQTVESNFVTPMILGRRLELSTVAIIIFLALTTWMWGIVGTIIGVPILVVIKVFCDNFPALAPLAEFLSGEARDHEEEPDIT
jgi:predicted PurR-regulated permease PerM